LKNTSIEIKKNADFFSESQVKKLCGKKRIKWGDRDLVRAISLKAASKKAFRLVKEEWKVPLPSASTLSRWMQKFTCKEGILKNVVEVLKIQGKEMDSFSKLCVINFDEMNVSSEIAWDSTEDKIVGPVSNAQVILLRGLCSNWKQPIFYGFDTDITSELLITVIDTIENVGYHVVAVVSDLGGKNQSLWKHLGINEKNSFFVNPKNREKVHVFADIPHMLKLLRNHILDEGIMLKNRIVIDKLVFATLVQKNELELKLCPKLNRSLLELTGAQRMKVKPAAQLLSAHSAALASHCFPQSPEISNFIQTINDLFDLFNSRSPNVYSKITSAFGVNIENQLNLLESAKRLMLSFRVQGKNSTCRKGLIWFQKGFIVSIESLKNLRIDLLKYNVSYILTGRLTQDALENIFSVIRAMGNQNQNPSPLQFKNRLRMLLLGCRLPVPHGANVTSNENDITSFTSQLCQKAEYDENLFVEKETVTSVDEVIESVINNTKTLDSQGDHSPDDKILTAGNLKIRDEALKYISGYIAYKLKKQGILNLGDPSSSLTGESVESESWIKTLSKGGLMVPCAQLVAQIVQMETEFPYLYCKYEKNKLCENIITALTQSFPLVKKDVIRQFVKLRIRIRIAHINSAAKQERKNKWASINAKKVKMFVNSSKM